MHPITSARLRESPPPHDQTTAAYTFQHACDSIRSGQSAAICAQQLITQLSGTERLWILDGDEPFWTELRQILCDRYNRTPFIHGAIPRLGIPGIRFTDGPRGVVMGASTAFPIAMARGATWDTDLERRIGGAIGLEGRAQGANYFAGVCINLPRHPAWGRIQETYSEDPLLLGEFGVALTEGVQDHIMACVKHFALNSMENARFRVDVKVDEATLHEVYLPHFRRVVEAGVASVMSSYNSVNGEWAGQNRNLLTNILRNEWGFSGFTLSDFIFGLRDAVLSVQNGLDIEAPFRQQRAMHLEAALASGKLHGADVDRACLRILSKSLEFGARVASAPPSMKTVFCDEHRALAREAATRSMTLLKNDMVAGRSSLPLNGREISTLAVIGRLANASNTGDKGSSQVFPPQVVTPFEGLQAALSHAKVVLEDSDSAHKAGAIAANADVAVCIVGYDARDEGEYVVPSLRHDPGLNQLLPPATTDIDKDTSKVMRGAVPGGEKRDTGLEVGAGGDRASLRLRRQDIDIINATLAANPRTIIAVIAAGAVIMEEWRHAAPAILMSWYSGSEGGHALADVLLGAVDASGHLPFSIPTDEAHLPSFDKDAKEMVYDRWFGQDLLDKLGVPAAYPLGFGLSYTSFRVSQLDVSRPVSDLIECNGETLNVQFTLANVGERPGRYVAQAYGKMGLPGFPLRKLMGFGVFDLAAQEVKRCSMSVSVRPLQRWRDGKFVLLQRKITIEVGAYSGDGDALCAVFQLQTTIYHPAH